jgi:TonB family protein
MKRFLLISALFHLGVVLLLFSWEIPLTDRLLPGRILEVSLVELIEKKLERAIPESVKQGRIPFAKKEKKDASAGKKEKDEIKEVIAPPMEEKKEDLKTELAQKPVIEEKSKTEKVPEEDPALEGKKEEAPVIQARLTPQGKESAESGGPMSFLSSHPAAGGRGDAVTAFLASAGPESAREGIPLGGGGKGSASGRGEGGSSRLTGVPKSGGDGDPIIGEIIRRIEAAKRYPRMAQKMGIEGRAAVRFRLASNGKLESVELLESSGSEVLDQASLETVRRAAPLPYKDGWLRVVIVFKIQ